MAAIHNPRVTRLSRRGSSLPGGGVARIAAGVIAFVAVISITVASASFRMIDSPEQMSNVQLSIVLGGQHVCAVHQTLAESAQLCVGNSTACDLGWFDCVQESCRIECTPKVWTYVSTGGDIWGTGYFASTSCGNDPEADHGLGLTYWVRTCRYLTTHCTCAFPAISGPWPCNGLPNPTAMFDCQGILMSPP